MNQKSWRNNASLIDIQIQPYW